MSDALFAYTVEDQWVRVSEFVETPEADRMFEVVQDLPREGYVSVEVWNPTRLEYRPVQVKHFALRPNMHQWPSEYANVVTRIRLWSKRTYVNEVAAAKAWNRATGNRYHGTEGGWIYRTEDNHRMVQGWTKLLGSKRLGRSPQGYRYLAKTVSLRETVGV